MDRQCPKCKDRGLHETIEMSQPSSLERHQETAALFTKIVKCIYCGWRDEMVAEDTKPMPEKPIVKKKSVFVPTLAWVVRNNYDIICKRHETQNYRVISGWIKEKFGVFVTPQTLSYAMCTHNALLNKTIGSKKYKGVL